MNGIITQKSANSLIVFPANALELLNEAPYIPYAQRPAKEFWLNGKPRFVRTPTLQTSFNHDGHKLREDEIENGRFTGSSRQYNWDEKSESPWLKVEQVMTSKTEGWRKIMLNPYDSRATPDPVTIDPQTGIETITDCEDHSIIMVNQRASADNDIIKSTQHWDSSRSISIYNSGKPFISAYYMRTRYLEDFKLYQELPDGTLATNSYERNKDNPKSGIFLRKECEIEMPCTQPGYQWQHFLLWKDPARPQIKHSMANNRLQHVAGYSPLGQIDYEVIYPENNPALYPYHLLIDYGNAKEEIQGRGTAGKATPDIIAGFQKLRGDVILHGANVRFQGLPDPSLVMPASLKLEI